MPGNHFGQCFRIVTWGESHGKAIGCVIDGCPSKIPLTEEMIQKELSKRAPGNMPHTSARKEPDRVEILSGVYQGQTTGAPISLLILNQDARPKAYEGLENLLRPGHASYTYQKKYGIFDPRGGGRASARETACRVAAGAVALQVLKKWDISLKASLIQVGSETDPAHFSKLLEAVQKKGDSIGGAVELVCSNVPVGLGEPIYEKMEAKLAHAMLSLPAAKGFEIGSGFSSVGMHGSEHNDLFDTDFTTKTNHAGGVLAGITTGMPLVCRVAFKPTSSIAKTQATVNLKGEKVAFTLPKGSRHDPCVAIRACPVVSAMGALVLVDTLLLDQRTSL